MVANLRGFRVKGKKLHGEVFCMETSMFSDGVSSVGALEQSVWFQPQERLCAF